MTTPIILCETPSGCTCGAPASTPAGMHHCDCAVHPGWCGQPGCLPCEENGRVIRPAVEAALSQLDGTDESAVSLMTGLTSTEIADLGGLSARPGDQS